MINWNEYRQQVAAGITEIARSSPDIVRGYRTIANARTKEGALDAKTRELVALAVAVTSVHVDLAKKNGATQDEITDALGVAVMVNAGAALIYSTRALDALHALPPAEAPAPKP